MSERLREALDVAGDDELNPAWARFVDAEDLHKGHGDEVEGIGSAITNAARTGRWKQFDSLYGEKMRRGKSD